MRVVKLMMLPAQHRSPGSGVSQFRRSASRLESPLAFKMRELRRAITLPSRITIEPMRMCNQRIVRDAAVSVSRDVVHPHHVQDLRFLPTLRGFPFGGRNSHQSTDTAMMSPLSLHVTRTGQPMTFAPMQHATTLR